MWPLELVSGLRGAPEHIRLLVRQMETALVTQQTLLGPIWMVLPAAARELLAPVYGWFTEGFDTADLQEAKVLLEARV